MALEITTASHDRTTLLDLPWTTPLEQWPEDQIVALPRGISRHIVRFVRLDGHVYAVKEVAERPARQEYSLLRALARLEVPCVEAVAVITGRVGGDGEPLSPALVTRHLQYSLPYRAVFSRTLREPTLNRLLDALVALLVRLHLNGFMWGDCSLSNTLFRRDAGAFAAYLVDAETGELHRELSDGQRLADIDLARVNLAGELLDLEAGGLLHESIDPVATGGEIEARYLRLWEELYGREVFDVDQRYRIDARIRRLNDLGFDVDELTISTDLDGQTVQLQPKVVDAGHHQRRLLRLTGLDAEENQARRLLNDLDSYRAATDRQADDEEVLSHEWLSEVFEPTIAAIPRELRGKLEQPELFHEVLEHRWYLSEAAGRDVGLPAATRSYVESVLAGRPDEKAVLGSRIGVPTQPMAGPGPE